MDIPIEVRKLVNKAIGIEKIKETKRAEDAYLSALRQLGARAPVFRGVLFINLGRNAEQAGRLTDAAAFFRNSIELLKSERGDAHLHCAHAYFNLAYLLHCQDDPAALVYAAEASKRYHANPFADPVDRVDASMLSLLCRFFIESSPDEKMFRETWAEVRSIRADALNAKLLEKFLIKWLLLNRHIAPAAFTAVRAEVHAWLSTVPDLNKKLEKHFG